MSINAIRLRRFRGFSDATLPLRPLTVLLGPNSSGKSCFIQALVALKQAHGADQSEIDLARAREPIDLGEYQDVVQHGAKDQPVEIHLETEQGWIEMGFGGRGADADTTPAFFEKGLLLTWLSFPTSDSAYSTAEVAGLPTIGAEAKIKVVQTTEEPVVGANAPHAASKFRRKNKAGFWRVEDEPGLEAELIFRGLRLRSAQTVSTRSALDFPATPLDDLASFLNTIIYLKPNRADPARDYRLGTSSEGGIGAHGEATADYLLHHGKDEVPLVHPPQCPTNPEDASRQIEAGDSWPGAEEGGLKRPLMEACDHWLQRTRLAHGLRVWENGTRVRLDARMYERQPEHPLTDLGFGVSQVLPILVAGLKLPEHGTLVVEHPEAQLHPRAQAELADFFCALVKTGRRALVATHSEAFFSRLRLRAAMDPELAAEVGVHFLPEPDSSGVCSQPQAVVLDENQEPQWPQGFFSEGLDSALSLLAVRDALFNRATSHQEQP